MMDKLKRFLQTHHGRALAAVIVVAGAVGLFLAVRSYFSPDDPARKSRERIFICSQTGKPFTYTLKLGDSVPVRSPHSGSSTGYPAEFCYWTADGNAKQDPTAVLLNEFKGQAGPTFCPDCGRLVRSHNPAPGPGNAPPRKRSEMSGSELRHVGRRSD